MPVMPVVPAVMVVVVPVLERVGLAEPGLPSMAGSGVARAGHGGRRRDGEHDDDQCGHRRDALHGYSSSAISAW